jgi:hypothetical protein
MAVFVENLIHAVEIENDGGGNPIYVGLANPGSLTSAPVWRILKIGYDGGGFTASVKWADGNLDFDKIWDNRGTYTYS